MSKSSLTPSSVSQKLSTIPLAAHPADHPAASSNKSGRHSFVVKLHLVVAGTELGDDDPFILYWYCPLWLHSQVYNILKTLSEFLPSINTPQPILMTLQPYRFIPPCHRLSFSQVHQMVSSPFQIQQKQTRMKRCYTSVRGALASPMQTGTAQVPTHRHMEYGPLATWKHSVSGRTRSSILSEINSPSSLILPSSTSCCHPTFALLQSTPSLGFR